MSRHRYRILYNDAYFEDNEITLFSLSLSFACHISEGIMAYPGSF